MHFRSLVFSTAVLAFATTSNGQTVSVSLRDAVQRALQDGTSAQLARTAEERARIARAEALSNLLPQADARVVRYNQSVNLETFGFSTPGQPPVVGPFNVTDAQITGAMQLFNIAAIRRLQASNAGARASRLELEQAENDVAAAVARLYLLVQRASAQIASREADVTLFARLAEVTKDEFQAGTGTRLDVAQANVQLSRARQSLLVAQNDRQNAAFALLNAIGASEASDLAVTDTIPATEPPPPIEPAVASARERRPEVRAAIARELEARLGVSAAESRRLPSLGADFEGDFSGNRTDDLRWTRRIAGTVSVPLFRADINANAARARAQLRDAQIVRAQRERDVEQDVRRSIMNLTSAEARVQVAQESVAVAEEALTVARDRRAAGYGSPVEVDRAQDVYRQAHEDLITARADAAAAHFDVLHATGDIRRLIGAGE